MQNREINNEDIESLMVRAIKDFAEKKVDEMMEQSIEKFKNEIEEKRMEMVIGVMARVREYYETNQTEMIVRIPFTKIR